ncbi:MAG: phosphoribosylformylglycinamidine synthase subunit PurS [Candidatus Dormibacteria bacterium]
MAEFRAEVHVVLKPLVNDPAGLVIRDGLNHIGFNEVASVRAGKYITIQLEAQDLTEARGRVEEMCRKLLSNPVIEEYRFEIQEGAAA